MRRFLFGRPTVSLRKDDAGDKGCLSRGDDGTRSNLRQEYNDARQKDRTQRSELV